MGFWGVERCFFWGGGTFPSAIACFKYHPAVRPKRSYSIPFVDVGGRCLTLSLIKSASDRAVWVQPKRAGPQMVGEAGQNDKMHCKGTERKTQSMDCMGSILTCLKFKAMATYRCFYSTPSPRKIGVYSFAFHCHDLDMLYQLRRVACSGCR